MVTDQTAARAAKSLPLIFSLTLFVSAFLLFWVQPLVAKMLLPLLGGAPAVWNTCMLFFQAMLLAGYFYVYAVDKWLGIRRQAIIHIALLLLAAASLPFVVSDKMLRTTAMQDSPILWLLSALVVMVGAPFFILSTTAPLLQKWFSNTEHPSAHDPYFLYAASNVGSLLSLLLFPLLLEPELAIRRQSRLWAGLYLLLALLVFACASRVWGTQRRRGEIWQRQSVEPITAKQRLLWIALAFAPSSLMLGLTTHISTDIAAVPLLWIIPLSIYLLTFILTFAKRQPLSLRLMTLLLPGAAMLVGLDLLFKAAHFQQWVLILIHLIFFFVAAMVCHGRLAGSRPHAEHLAEFFLWVAVGGVLGGIFNVLVAPYVFNSVAEYPIAILLACLLSPRRSLPLFLSLAVLCTSFYFKWSQPMIYAERSFFGVLRVENDQEGKLHRLSHGSTIHGKQFTDPSRKCEPLAYYHRSGPLGSVFAAFDAKHSLSRDVAVIGLGSGAAVTYSRPDQRWTYYEIDPAVIRIARNPAYFTFLQDCAAAPVEMIVGDARLRIREAAEGVYGLIVLDAFSSDAIPMHLVTRQALELYLSKLAPDGMLAFHISNVRLDLGPVMAGLSKSENLVGYGFADKTQDAANVKDVSYWVVMARNSESLGGLDTDPRWRPLAEQSSQKVWTDDFSDILSVLKWR